MSVQSSRKCQKDLQFDRFLEAVGPVEDSILLDEFDTIFRQLMALRRNGAAPSQEAGERVWPAGAQVPLTMTKVRSLARNLSSAR